jgi:hypothetical protein
MAEHNVEGRNELRHVLTAFFIFWSRVQYYYCYHPIRGDIYQSDRCLIVVTVMGAIAETRSRAVRGIDRTSSCHVPGQTIGMEVIVAWEKLDLHWLTWNGGAKFPWSRDGDNEV